MDSVIVMILLKNHHVVIPLGGAATVLRKSLLYGAVFAKTSNAS